MYLVEEHYYTINRAFLKALGIWHHDRSRLALLQRILIIVLLVTYLSIQLAVFITRKYDMALFVKTMSMALPYVLITLKYCTFILKSKAITRLYHLIQENWKIIQNKLESEILWEHIRQSHTYTIQLTFLCSLITIVGIIIQFLPVILDVITPLNESRPREIIISVEYFVLQDKYFYTQVLHEIVILFLCALMMLATSIQLIIFTYHCFGMFKIASYRVEHSIEDSVLRMPIHEQKRIFCKRLMHAVIAHRRAMEFSNALVSPFNVPYCIIAIVGVFSLSISLYRFIDAVTGSNKIQDIMIPCLIVLCHIIYMYVGNYFGQVISDCNYEILKSMYATSWYLMPVSSQKLVLFLMQKSNKDFTFTIGFIFTAKIESFATLVNSAMSYVTVMLSTQRKTDDR